MKVCVLAHSLVALRQQLFLKELARLCPVLAIAPEQWGKHKSTKTIIKTAEQDYEFINYLVMQSFRDYTFPESAFDKIKRFRPDIIYSITEPSQKQFELSYGWAKRLDLPLVIFSWENIARYPNVMKGMVRKVICGNPEAQMLFNDAGFDTELIIFPGIDTSLFRCKPTKERDDLIFVGRDVVEKGIATVNLLHKDFSILQPKDVGYAQMPSWYNNAKIQIVPSLNTLMWKEQFPSCIAEGLACEIPAVAYDTGSIRSMYAGCDAVILVPENSSKLMQKEIMRLLSNEGERIRLGKLGRRFVESRYSNEVVAKETDEVLKKCLNSRR